MSEKASEQTGQHGRDPVLHRRLRRLEGLALGATVAASAILTAMGFILPFITGEAFTANESVTVSLLEFALGTMTGPESNDPVVLAIGLGILALAVVCVVLIWLSLADARGGARADVVIRGACVLVLVGCGILWALFAFGAARVEWRLEIGLPLLTAGAIVSTMYAYAPVYRELRNA